MQLQGELGAKPTIYRHTFDAIWKIGAAEGIPGLQRGLPAACLWQFSNVSMRFGVYGAAKTFLDMKSETSFRWMKSLALAAVSGGLGSLISNPFFILKTRYQASDAKTSARMPSVRHAFISIGQQEGWRGYFRGLSAFCPRVMVASGVQLSTYDEVKHEMLRAGFSDGLPCVVASSWITGIAVVACMQPFDFAATRLVNQKTAGALYTGPLDCIVKTVKTEGISGVYKGVLPNYLRFGPYCILVFVFLEQLKKISG